MFWQVGVWQAAISRKYIYSLSAVLHAINNNDPVKVLVNVAAAGNFIAARVDVLELVLQEAFVYRVCVDFVMSAQGRKCKLSELLI